MEKQERDKIISLIQREVVPAIGCTEPIAVALGVAKATELLGMRPESIRLQLSANILKNAMGVGIPGTGMIGLPIAIALGALIGKSEYELEVLKDATPEWVEEGKKMIAEHCIEIKQKKESCDKLYIEVTCSVGENSATAIISHGHTHFVYLEKNGEVLLNEDETIEMDGNSESIDLTLEKVYEFATTAPTDEIRFILKAAELNSKAAECGLKQCYGHCIGHLLDRSMYKDHFMGDSLLAKIISYTSAACDARMGGAPVPGLSNSGSGNQGIATTLPVYVYAKENHKSEEELIRALILSHLTAIYIKQSLGRLSALCGCVVASTGSSCGITYLMGGNYENVSYAVQNMIATLTGMLCDGAKPSCAIKVTSGVSTAVLCAMMAMDKRHVTGVEGIIDEDVNKSIRNMTRIGASGMNETDKYVLDIMTGKE